jgi:hypothetical protein
MANTGTLTAGLAFIVTLFSVGASAAQDEGRTLILHVDNYARIPSADLARAEYEATRVYDAAGVRTIWVHGDDEASGRDAGGLHLRVLLLCNEMTNRKVANDNIELGVLGRAARPTRRAYVFTPRVVDVALRNGMPIEITLGRVMAHEIGHLLLGAGSHASAGIMREHLNLANKSLLTFTAPQTAQIQMALNN